MSILSDTTALESQLEPLEREYDTLDEQRKTLADRHDADAETFFEEEPWHPEYQRIEAEQQTILDRINALEIEMVAARKEEEKQDRSMAMGYELRKMRLVPKDDSEGRVVLWEPEKEYYFEDDGSAAEESFVHANYLATNKSEVPIDKPGNFPWDRWQAWAIEDGVPKDLIPLGRDLIREAHQHKWPMELQVECGWHDDGQQMIQLAILGGDYARQRWQHLLATDGLRNEDEE